MPTGILSVDNTLSSSRRWVLPHVREPAPSGARGAGLSPMEWGVLLLSGAAAALATVYLDMDRQAPGNAILRAVLPMSFGLACVPRRGAGCVMGGSAIGLAALLRLAGQGPGLGALTSLALTGPCLDIALRRAKPGWRLYLAFALAGLVSNTGAMLVRGTMKWFGLEGVKRPFASWFAEALFSYPLFGIAAGLIGAAVCFRLRGGQASGGRQPAEHARSPDAKPGAETAP
jgi:hypothetical protein